MNLFDLSMEWFLLSRMDVKIGTSFVAHYELVLSLLESKRWIILIFLLQMQPWSKRECSWLKWNKPQRICWFVQFHIQNFKPSGAELFFFLCKDFPFKETWFNWSYLYYHLYREVYWCHQPNIRSFPGDPSSGRGKVRITIHLCFWCLLIDLSHCCWLICCLVCFVPR